MHQAPIPDPRELLPPLLACLPTAFVSLRPPPALLPLLSPLLRQRVSFLVSNGNPRSDGWLPLLSWDGERGARLPEIVERMQLEPHPVSGELELEDIRPAKYRRLDEETLHAKFEVEQFEILPVYVWCERDEHGGTDPGWKLSELRSIEDTDDGLDWYDTVSEANDAAQSRLAVPTATSGPNGDRKASLGNSDDDYWAAYDRTPNITPAVPAQSTTRDPHGRQRSVSELEYFARYADPEAPARAPSNVTAFQRRHPARQRSQSEFDYFSRYGNEVQPAMDAHDPDEEKLQEAQRTLNRDSVIQPDPPAPQRTVSRPSGASLFPADKVEQFPAYNDIPAPRPISPASSHGSIDRLEQRARAMSEADKSQSSEFAQTAIKQHISTDIKSLFRLAKNTGIARSDFERIVKTELDCLSMLEDDEE